MTWSLVIDFMFLILILVCLSRGHEEYKPKDYKFECLVDDKFYFIMSPRDVVVGKPRDEDDHVDWLVQHQRFQEALALTQEKEKYLKKHSFQEVGGKYLEHLLGEKEFKLAGELCTSLLAKDKRRWEEQVFRWGTILAVEA